MSSKSGGGIAWADEPHQAGGTMFPIYTPTPDRSVNVVILTEKVLGVYIHYYDRRTRPCTGPAGECEGCYRGFPKRWKGYLAAWDRHKGRLCIAEITHEAFTRCLAFKDMNGALRGRVLRLERKGESRTSRVDAKLAMFAGEGVALPPEFDLKAALERVWWTEVRGERPKPQQPEAGERCDDFDGQARTLFSEGR